MPKINALFELDLLDETSFHIMQRGDAVTLFPHNDTECTVTLRRDVLLAILERLAHTTSSFDVSVE